MPRLPPVSSMGELASYHLHSMWLRCLSHAIMTSAARLHPYTSPSTLFRNCECFLQSSYPTDSLQPALPTIAVPPSDLVRRRSHAKYPCHQDTVLTRLTVQGFLRHDSAPHLPFSSPFPTLDAPSPSTSDDSTASSLRPLVNTRSPSLLAATRPAGPLMWPSCTQDGEGNIRWDA